MFAIEMMKEKSKIQYLPLFIYLPGTRLPSMSIASTPLSSYDKNRYRIVKFVDGRQESLTSLPPPPQRDVIIQLDIDTFFMHHFAMLVSPALCNQCAMAAARHHLLLLSITPT